MTAIYQILLLISFSWVFAVTFYDDLIPMTFNGETLDKPFLGGLNRPKIQWLDWDVDGDLDLFILDASGYLRYLENHGSSSIPNFHIITPSFKDIFCGGWFYFADYDDDAEVVIDFCELADDLKHCEDMVFPIQGIGYQCKERNKSDESTLILDIAPPQERATSEKDWIDLSENKETWSHDINYEEWKKDFFERTESEHNKNFLNY